MEESNFKIIAIRALPNCNDKFTKVLEKGKIYYFYSGYKIESIGNGVETIKKLECDLYPESLFNVIGIEKNINVNVCAIVGKNGSGKSSIIELLFRAINNIACNYKWKKDDLYKTIKAKLKFVEGVYVEFYYQTDKIYKIIVTNQTFIVHSFNSVGKLNKEPESKFHLGKLFYTEAVNYSYYAYNSLEFAFNKGNKKIDWLSELFHKNDSYQTPLVLNPMRTEGNFDINRENDLVKQRLLANILRPVSNNNVDFRKFGDNLIAKKLIFTLKDSKKSVEYWDEENNVRKTYDVGVFQKEQQNEIVEKLMSKLVDVPKFDFDLLTEKCKKNAGFYIIYKLVFICRKYEDYHKYLDLKDNRFHFDYFDKLVEQVEKDHTHITFKLRQTLNYLKNDYIDFLGAQKEISLDTLSRSIQKRIKKGQSILELIPPPIFEINIILNTTKQVKPIIFGTLSSGEKQQIIWSAHCSIISTILIQLVEKR